MIINSHLNLSLLIPTKISPKAWGQTSKWIKPNPTYDFGLAPKHLPIAQFVFGKLGRSSRLLLIIANGGTEHVAYAGHHSFGDIREQTHLVSLDTILSPWHAGCLNHSRTCSQAHVYMQALERNDMDAETAYTESGETTFKMSITSKPEDGEALTRFNAKADRKILLKLDLLLVPMCCAM